MKIETMEKKWKLLNEPETRGKWQQYDKLNCSQWFFILLIDIIV